MTYVRRKINATITLGSGDFGEGKGNTVTLTGLRVVANIQKTAMPALDTATVQIYGVTRDFMNRTTRLGKPIQYVRDNTIALSAGDDTSGMSQVFYGTIYNSYGDFDGMPEAAVTLTAMNGLVDLSKPVPPLSFPSGASVAAICAQIAASMGKTFINNGVTVTLPGGLYYPGTAIDQLRAVAQAAGVNAIANGGPLGQNVEIWPLNGQRGGSVPLISAATGLVGYPKYSDTGIKVRALYNPGLTMGALFQLQTEITPAVGLWNVFHLSYDLESEKPGGAWFQDIDAILPADRGGNLQT